MKYQPIFENGQMRIRELTDWMLEGRNSYEKERNTFDSVKIFNTIDECIKYLRSYTQTVLLLDGSTVIPDHVNYQNYHDMVFKRVRFPLNEVLA